jgi:hypothetical protein
MTIVFNIDFTTENVTAETTNALTFGEGGGGGGAVASVNGKTGVVILTAANISETSTRLWLTDVLKTAYDSAVAWIATNGANLLNHLANLSNPHQTTASQVGAYTTSETDTLLNAKANDNAVVKKTDYTPAHSFLVQQSGTGTPTALQVGNNTLLGRLSGGGSNIDDLSVSQVKTLLSYTPADIGAQPALGFTPENVANKATTFSTINDTLYPSVEAVNEQINLKTGQTAYITTGDITTSSNVASNITGLVATLEANKRYRIFGQIRTGCNNTGGVRFAASFPSGASTGITIFGFTTSGSVYVFTRISASDTLIGQFNQVNASSGFVYVFGEIETSATAGDIQFQFASFTNTQTSTIYELGTWLNITEL